MTTKSTRSRSSSGALPPVDNPPLRADAARNRQRVLEVARQVFAAEGLAVPIDEIAKRAGLGVGTLYRHFPTKEALLEAILVARMEEVTLDARARAEGDDPDEAFFGFLARMGEENLAKKDLFEALSRAGFDLQRSVAVKKEMLRAIDHLLDRAKAAGALRKDVAVHEVLALVTASFTAMERYGGDARARERMFTIVCDGLRPPRRGR
jgi:AcrR family transcriptional regulator